MGFLNLHIKQRYLFSSLFIIILIALFFPLHAFIVIDEKADIQVYSGLVFPGDIFEIHYIHSVEHMHVSGIFLINDKYKIEPVETVFPSYGAGMPFDVLKKNLVCEKGMMRVRHNNIELDELRIFISHITRQRVIFKKVEIDLYKEIKDGGIAVIIVRHSPLLFALFY